MDGKIVNNLGNYISYVNPLNCDLSFVNCKTYLYFVVGTILLLTVGMIVYYDSFTGPRMALSLACMCVIFLLCSVVLLNLCKTGNSSLYSYATIGVSALVAVVVFLMLKK